MKGHITPKRKKRAIHRLKIIEGKIRGLQKMIEEEKYCVDILIQSLSVQASLKSFNTLMLENHLDCHIISSGSKQAKSKLISELLKIYTLNNKS